MAVNHADPDAVDPVGADDIELVERLVVAPVTGVFFPRSPTCRPPARAWSRSATRSACWCSPARSTLVISPFTGELLGMLAEPGERVRMYHSPWRGSRSPTSRAAVRAFPCRPAADADRCGPTERAT